MSLITSSLVCSISIWLAVAVGAVSFLASLSGLFGFSKVAKIFSRTGLAGLWGLQVFLVGAVSLRWIEVGHEPWQTLFEVLLLCSAFLVMSYLLVRYALREFREGRVAGIIFDLFTAFSVASVAIMLAIASGKDDSASVLPPALKSAWMAPHVIAYIFAYATLSLASVGVVTWWAVKIVAKIRPGFIGEETVKWISEFDRFSYAITAVGFPFLTAALLMGSLWGQDAWGNYWGWDSKEVAALISWIVYVIYFHLRFIGGWKGGRLHFVLFMGAVSIFVCFLLFSYLPASFSSLHKYAG